MRGATPLVRGVDRQSRAQLGRRHGERVRPQTAFVGHELEGTEPPRIVEQKMPAVSKSQAGPHPLVVEDPRAIEQAIERLLPVHHQTAGHAETNAERRTIICVEE